MDTIIRNGKVVTASGMFEVDVGIEDGKISRLSTTIDDVQAENVIDASGKLVMPGVVDPHVHIDDMYSIDTYETATRAAALGGTTTLIDFAWQAWRGETSHWEEESTLLAGIERKREKAKNSYIDYGLHGGITRTDLDVLDELVEAVEKGITSFKMFTAYEVGLPNGFINRVFQKIAELDAVAALHTEDGSVCDALTEQFREQDRGEASWYPKSRPAYAEAMAAEDAVRMATEAGCKYYGVHTSSEDAGEVLAEFRKRFPSLVRFETCTHYTTHDDSLYQTLGNLPMMAPPLRSRADIESLFDYLERGVMDVVSTDHCAFKRAEKKGGEWWESSFGTNSLQTSFHIFHDIAINQRGFSYPFLVRKFATNPAHLFGLPEKGTLDPGTDADIVIFDPNVEHIIDSSENESRANYSLYDGREVTGRVETTFVRGERVVDDFSLVGNPGHGEFVERSIPDWHP
ncbi:dihydropyrimidinase [Halorubrum trueperi]